MAAKPKIIYIATLGVIALVVGTVVIMGGSAANKGAGVAPTPQMQAMQPPTPSPTDVYVAVARATTVGAIGDTLATTSPVSSPAGIATQPGTILATSTSVASRPAVSNPLPAASATFSVSSATSTPTSTPVLISGSIAPAPTPLPVSGQIIYQADFSSEKNFVPYTLGEGDYQLQASGGQLSCAAPIGGLGDGDVWLAPNGAPTLAASDSVTITVGLRSSGEPTGFIFDQSSTGGQNVRLSGSRTATYVAVDEYVGSGSRYPGDGHWGTPGPATRLNLPFTGGWHRAQLQLTLGHYQLTIDGQAAGAGKRSGAGGAVMMYAVCDGAAFNQFTISH